MQEVRIGSTAPGLPALTFLCGPSVDAVETGNLYVIHLWATWCGGSPESLKHLDALQSRYPEATFLSVAILEPDPAGVETYIQRLDFAPAHSIAIDSPLKGDTSSPKNPRSHGWMARYWFDASYQQAVPVIFIVNKSRQIAWIGYLDALEEPLREIYSGQWDLEAQAEQYRVSLMRNRTRERHLLREKIREAHLNERFGDVVETIDQAGNQDAVLAQEQEFILAKLNALMRIDDRQPDALQFANNAARFSDAYGPGFGMSIAAIFLNAPVIDFATAKFAVPLLLQSRDKYEQDHGKLRLNDQIRFGMCAARGMAALREISRAMKYRQSTEDLIGSATIPENIKNDMLRSLSQIGTA